MWGENNYGQLGILNDDKSKLKSADQPRLVSYFEEKGI